MFKSSCSSLYSSLSPPPRAQNEITLLSPNPLETTINTQVADFEAKTGTHVTVTCGIGVSTRKTIASGGALDVSLRFAPFPEVLATGNIDRRSAKADARMRLASAVKKGPAPGPLRLCHRGR